MTTGSNEDRIQKDAAIIAEAASDMQNAEAKVVKDDREKAEIDAEIAALEYRREGVVADRAEAHGRVVADVEKIDAAEKDVKEALDGCAPSGGGNPGGQPPAGGPGNPPSGGSGSPPAPPSGGSTSGPPCPPVVPPRRVG